MSGIPGKWKLAALLRGSAHGEQMAGVAVTSMRSWHADIVNLTPAATENRASVAVTMRVLRATHTTSPSVVPAGALGIKPVRQEGIHQNRTQVSLKQWVLHDWVDQHRSSL